MTSMIDLGDFISKITPIKYQKQIYWVTTPHLVFIDKDREYKVNYNDLNFNVKLYKISYKWDLAIFKSCEKINIKLNELKIIKSNKIIYNSKIYNSDKTIEGIVTSFEYIHHLELKRYNRNLFYGVTINDGLIDIGDSGSGFYTKKNQLIGLIAKINNEKNKCFLVPGLFIIKLLNEIDTDFIPYLPIKLDIGEKYSYLVEKFNTLPKGYEIKKFNKKQVVNKIMVYYKEINDYIPFDVYFMIVAKKNKKIFINEHKFKIKDLNDYLKAPFVSGITQKEFDSITTETYQSLYLKKHTTSDPDYYQYLIENNFK